MKHLFLNKTDKMVVRILVCIIIACAAGIWLTSCSADAGEQSAPTPVPARVTLQFSPYTMAAMTRAATSIADVATRLDVWIINSSDTIALHQKSSDDDFGQPSVTLDKTKTYKLCAVAHKCSAAATMSDSLISFADAKVLQTLYYQTTFTPQTSTTLSCEMQRIVGQFKLQTTDAVPDAVVKVNVSTPQALTKWNTSALAGSSPQDYAVIFSPVSKNKTDGTAAFTIYVIGSDEEHTRTITVAAYDASDSIIQQRTFEDVPMKNGYITKYQGAFFTNQEIAAAFTVESNWQEYDVTEF